VYEINSIIFFLSRLLFLGVILDLDKYVFPWQMSFIWRGRLRLESSWIWVITVILAVSQDGAYIEETA
jgi:hypothetical protein